MTITERGLEFHKSIQFELPLGPQYQTSSQSKSPQYKTLPRSLYLESLIKAAVSQSPPERIQIKTPRIFRHRGSAAYTSSGDSLSPTRVHFAANNTGRFPDSVPSSPRSLQRMMEKEQEKVISRKMPTSVVITKGLKIEKLKEKQLFLQQQRVEMDTELKNRIDKIRIHKLEQLMEFKNKIETQDLVFRRELSPILDKERYRIRVRRLYDKRQVNWGITDRIKKLATPLRGIISTPYYKMRRSQSTENKRENQERFEV